MKRIIFFLLLCSYSILFSTKMEAKYSNRYLISNNTKPFITYKHTEVKKISKEFNVNEDALLYIGNKYGTITLITSESNKNTIKIDVEIKVSSNKESILKEYLNKISVDFSQKGKESVSAKTSINNSSSIFKGFLSSNSVNYQINYTVSLPEKVMATIHNKYGDIFLNKTRGYLKINAEYGSAYLGELLADASITIQYSPNSSIEEVRNLNFNGEYSTIKISNVDYMKCHSEYTNIDIKKVRHLISTIEYGNLYVGQIANGEISSEYCVVSFNQVKEQLNLSSEYGNVRVEEILPTASFIKIDSEYGSVDVKYHKNWNFKYLFTSSYSEISIPNNLPFEKKNIRMTNSSISGVKNNGSNTFEVSNEYGHIKIIEK